MSAPNYTVDNPVGRLIEARIFVLADAVSYGAALKAAVQGIAGQMPVLLVDHRPALIFPPEAVDDLIEVLRSVDKGLARAALVANADNAVFTLQLGRMVREIGNRDRRLFFEPEAALSYLAPVLDWRERARAAAFLEDWQNYAVVE